jgi:hypothetical protein
MAPALPLLPLIPLLYRLSLLVLLLVESPPFFFVLPAHFPDGHPGGRPLYLPAMNFFQLCTLLVMLCIQLTAIIFLTLQDFCPGNTLPWTGAHPGSLARSLCRLGRLHPGRSLRRRCLCKLLAEHLNFIASHAITARRGRFAIHDIVTGDGAPYRPFNLLNIQAAIDHPVLDNRIICHIPGYIEKGNIPGRKNDAGSKVGFKQKPFFRKAPPMWFDISTDVHSYL